MEINSKKPKIPPEFNYNYNTLDIGNNDNFNEYIDVIQDLKDILYKYNSDDFDIKTEEIQVQDLTKLDTIWVYNKKYVMEVFQTKFNASDDYKWVIELFTEMITPKDSLPNMHKDYIQLVRLFLVAAHNKDNGEITQSTKNLLNDFTGFLKDKDPKYADYFKIQQMDIYGTMSQISRQVVKKMSLLATSALKPKITTPMDDLFVTTAIPAAAGGGGRGNRKSAKKSNKNNLKK